MRGGELPTITYRRAWIKARQTALTSPEQASPLARRPYDLRHACLSTWLNGGVYPTQVAEWAGHSVDVQFADLRQVRCGPGRASQAPNQRSPTPELTWARIGHSDLHFPTHGRIRPHKRRTGKITESPSNRRSLAHHQGFRTVGRVGLEPTTGGL